jgi:hypothetical protein
MYAGKSQNTFTITRNTTVVRFEVLMGLTKKFHSLWQVMWFLLLLLQSALQPLVGFRLAQLSSRILSRKVLQSAVASGTSNPQLGGELGI